MNVKDWIKHIQNIKVILNHMSEVATTLTNKQLIREVIVPNNLGKVSNSFALIRTGDMSLSDV